MLDKITMREHENLFSIHALQPISFEEPRNIWGSVTFEMDLNVLQYERQVYTFFDMLSEVGGLQGMLMMSFGYILSIWNYNSFDNFMVSRLFKIRKVDSEIKNEICYFEKSNFIRESKYPYFSEFFKSSIPARCKFCCKKSRKEKVM